jgi:hypothetical protein
MRRAPMTAVLLLAASGLRAQDSASALEHARQVNLDLAANLPNFVVDETAIRYKSRHTDPPKWEIFDKIDAELVVRGSGYKRQNVRRNGKPWKKPDYSDFNWGEQFGYELKTVFSPKCAVTIEFEGSEETHGKRLLTYKYHAPPNSCFIPFMIRSGFFSVKNYNPSRTGHFVIDDPGGNVIYFEELASEYPKGFGADPWKQTSSWDYVQIGDSSRLLPVVAEVFGGFTQGDLWHVVVEYKNHRHFEAATSITFK